MNAPKVGDRVRVVLEGSVSARFGPDVAFALSTEGFTNNIDPAAPYVVSVEVLPRPLKVGDVIETRAELDSLPTYSVVRLNTPSGLPASKHRNGAWHVAGGGDGSCNPLAWSGELYVLHIGRPE